VLALVGTLDPMLKDVQSLKDKMPQLFAMITPQKRRSVEPCFASGSGNTARLSRSNPLTIDFIQTTPTYSRYAN
jgi:hypothetical protein